MNNAGQARLTGVRREIKYLLDPAAGRKTLDELLEKVPAKSMDGSPSSFRVSVYLDDEERSFSQAELDKRSIITKMRIREYYLLEDGRPRFGDTCFVEVKLRSGAMVEKSRFALDRRGVEDLLQNGPPLSIDPEERAARETFESLRRGKPLLPIFITHYRRYTLQDKENRIRITLDDLVTFHMPSAGLITSGCTRCSRRDLAPPFLVEPNWIVEVKSLGAPPEWLGDVLDPMRQLEYSKFGTGVRELDRIHRLFPYDT